MLLGLLACFGPDEVETEVCADGWERPVGTCPEGEGDADTDTDADTDIDTDTDGDCKPELSEVWPDDGSDGHAITDPIRVRFADFVPEALVEIDGVEGQMVWGEDEQSVAFWPQEPLDPETTYEAVAEACGERLAVWRFTTGEHGQARSGELVGSTWLLDVENAEIIQPAGVGEVLASYLEGALLIEAVEQEGSELLLRVAAVDDQGDQNLCVATDELVVDFSQDPVFRYGPADHTSVFGAAFIGDLELRGVIASDHSSLAGVAAKGLIDTRPLNVLIEEDADDEAFCNLVAGFGVSCESCPDGTELCLEVEIEGLTGELVDSSIVPLETCDASCPEEDCGQCGCASGVGLRGGWLVALFALAGLSRRRRGDTARA